MANKPTPEQAWRSDYQIGYDNGVASQAAEIERLKGERDAAISMLAAWCVAVDVNGTAWDDWDEYYKDVMYRQTMLRELLDVSIAEERKLREDTP